MCPHRYPPPACRTLACPPALLHPASARGSSATSAAAARPSQLSTSIELYPPIAQLPPSPSTLSLRFSLLPPSAAACDTVLLTDVAAMGALKALCWAALSRRQRSSFKQGQ
ncbi:hypothetical protein B0H15DRAFT_953645 [Mycena belliarum]|uniref:Uncharacterized protein n=1 Tax=Mycena belliarum TaxID=1033014 RepID=A0AAD6XK09_9AGAR|nr:hypothetical protein B0H15DRAFT_953645 [Mycena belliae]